MAVRLVEVDPYLGMYEDDIRLRMDNYARKKAELLDKRMTLSEFANGHNYYGFHQDKKGWYYREWAPGADEIYLMGDFN